LIPRERLDFQWAELREFGRALHAIDPSAQVVNTIHDEFEIWCAPEHVDAIRALLKRLGLVGRVE